MIIGDRFISRYAKHTQTGKIINILHEDVRIPFQADNEKYYTEKYILYKRLDDEQLYAMRYSLYISNYKIITEEEAIEYQNLQTQKEEWTNHHY